MANINKINGLDIQVTGSNVIGTVTNAATASYINTLNVSGSFFTLSGSFINQVITLSTASGTASLNCSLGNFFDLTLSSSYSLHLTASNIRPGQTINMRITQPATSGSLNYGTQFKWPGGIPYSASATGSTTDIVSFISYDSTTLYGTAIKNLF